MFPSTIVQRRFFPTCHRKPPRLQPRPKGPGDKNSVEDAPDRGSGSRPCRSGGESDAYCFVPPPMRLAECFHLIVIDHSGLLDAPENSLPTRVSFFPAFRM